MACNLAIAVSKLIGGWAFESDIIITDGWHSISDLVCDGLTIIAVSLERATAESKSQRHIVLRNLGSLGLTLMLLVGGITLGLESARHLRTQLHMSRTLRPRLPFETVESVPSAPKIGAAWIAFGTIVVKQWLYQASEYNQSTHLLSPQIANSQHLAMRESRNQKSIALESNAAHHRMDSLSASVALVATLGSAFLNDAGWIDAVGGIGVSCIIVWSGIGTARGALQQLRKIRSSC